MISPIWDKQYSFNNKITRIKALANEAALIRDFYLKELGSRNAVDGNIARVCAVNALILCENAVC